MKFLYTFLLFIITSTAWAQKPDSIKVDRDSTLSGYKADIPFVNPTNKDVEMAYQDRKASEYRFDPNHTQPWFDFKRQLNEDTGLQISSNYTATFMGASSTIEAGGQKNAMSAIWDLTLKWNAINRNKEGWKGTFVYWIDSRHAYYDDFPVQNLYQETGSALIPALKFGKWSLRTLEFYYQQQLFSRLAVVVGKIDMADWFTYNGLLHPMMHFSDFGFSVNPTVSWSNTGLGVVVGGWLDKKKRFGLVAGFNDVAGDDITQNNFLDMGAPSWGAGKFLKMAEFNYSPKQGLYYFNRLSMTVWHSDAGTPDETGWLTTDANQGFSVQGTWFINNQHIPVVTFGYSEGAGANRLSKLNVSAMYGRVFENHDLFAIGLNYTESAITDRSQLLSEIFYRYTISKALVVTPVAKIVLNPALDPNTNRLFYYGLRTRISF